MEKYRQSYERCAKNLDFISFARLYEEMKGEMSSQILLHLNAYVEQVEKRSEMEKLRQQFSSTPKSKKVTIINHQKKEISSFTDSMKKTPSLSNTNDDSGIIFDGISSSSNGSSSSTTCYKHQQQQSYFNQQENYSDKSLLMTNLLPNQVWNAWVYPNQNKITGKSSSSLDDGFVYFDTVNNRLCCQRRGAVFYPSLSNEAVQMVLDKVHNGSICNATPSFTWPTAMPTTSSNVNYARYMAQERRRLSTIVENEPVLPSYHHQHQHQHHLLLQQQQQPTVAYFLQPTNLNRCSSVPSMFFAQNI